MGNEPNKQQQGQSGQQGHEQSKQGQQSSQQGQQGQDKWKNQGQTEGTQEMNKKDPSRQPGSNQRQDENESDLGNKRRAS
jgi:hypothetical protein